MDDPAARLELHLCRDFVRGYLNRALSNRKTATVNPSAIFLAARFSGLKVSAETLRRVLAEYRHPPT